MPHPLNEGMAVSLPVPLPAVHGAITGVNQAIVSGGLTQLLHALQCEDARLTGVHPENVQWYMDVLSKAIKDKAEVYAMSTQCTVCVQCTLVDNWTCSTLQTERTTS